MSQRLSWAPQLPLLSKQARENDCPPSQEWPQSWCRIDFVLLLFCMRYCCKCVFVYETVSLWRDCAQNPSNVKKHKNAESRGEKKQQQKQAGFSSSSHPHTGDWWQHSGFLHATNWIHRSLDKVDNWDCSSLKTGAHRQENGEGCKRGNIDEVAGFRTNKKFSPLYTASKALLHLVFFWGGERSIICVARKGGGWRERWAKMRNKKNNVQFHYMNQKLPFAATIK